MRDFDRSIKIRCNQLAIYCDTFPLAMLQFQPFTSSPDVSFWHEYAKRKIETYKLNEDPVEVQAEFSNDNVHNLPARMALQSSAFSSPTVAPFHFKAPGTLKICNTIETYKAFDKKQFFQSVTQQIWEDILSGAALKDLSLLNRFLIISFGDLKKYRFHYWFGFPALNFAKPIESKKTEKLFDVFDETQRTQLRVSYEDLRGYSQENSSNNVHTDEFAFFIVRQKDGAIRTIRLAEWETLLEVDEEIFIGCADPSGMENVAGWPARNLLILIAAKMKPLIEKLVDIRIVFLRQWRKEFIESSFVSTVELFPDSISSIVDEPPASVGWEKDTKGKLRPRYIELGATMDPEQIAHSQTTLNLKLMKWRLLPSLDLEKIEQTKCLLIGAGTLGCNVARALIGWGVKDITFIDNGTVSYSNPVRQSLFTFNDCLDGGRPKAVAAAESLKLIFPSLNARGIIMSIPMPGHTVSNDLLPQTLEVVRQLDQLIQEHDAIFLLTDSREARWLPTVIAAAHDKLCINAALGFDTFSVLRHGCSPKTELKDGQDRVGCYFCNDILAPTNTTAERSLDQQCTVTRPGVSMIASSYAVEILISLLHNEHGNKAPADETIHVTESVSAPLGLVPHQIRGFLTHFNNVIVMSPAYEKCTACSGTVIEYYFDRMDELITNVLNEPGFLERITGITEMLSEYDDVSIEWGEGDDDF